MRIAGYKTPKLRLKENLYSTTLTAWAQQQADEELLLKLKELFIKGLRIYILMFFSDLRRYNY